VTCPCKYYLLLSYHRPKMMILHQKNERLLSCVDAVNVEYAATTNRLVA
jgi:hypothetical protein